MSFNTSFVQGVYSTRMWVYYMTGRSLIIIAGMFIGISLYIENIGFYLRGIGSANKSSNLGYSLHVQLATLGRVGTFIGFPMLGLSIDRGSSGAEITNAPIYALITFIVLCLMSVRYENSLLKLLTISFRIHNKNQPFFLNLGAYDKQANSVLINKVLISGALAFSLVFIGVFLPFYFSSIYPQYRATILQLSPAVTMFGTFISIIYFDPEISKTLDNVSGGVVIIRRLMLYRIAISSLMLITLLVLR